MILDKFDPMLCLAYQDSDGPFYIRIDYDSYSEWGLFSKQEIDDLSNLNEVIYLDIQEPRTDRRWRIRERLERRKSTNFSS